MDKDTTRHMINVIGDGLNTLVIFAFIGVTSLAVLIVGIIAFLIWWLI